MQAIADRLDQHRAAVRAECAKRGIKIKRQGNVFRLLSPDCDMATVDLSWIRLEDLAPDRGASHL